MGVLKKIFFITIFVTCAVKLRAQTNAVLQRAFHNSYADENNKNYTAAINDIYPCYNENNYEINIRLGWLNYLNKNYNASQVYYQRAINIKPGSVEAKFGYVKPLYFLQNWDKVLEQYIDIIKIDPQNTQANYWAGIIYYNRKQYEAAIRCFRMVVTLYPFDYDGNHMLAWSYLMVGKKSDAASYFEKALLIKPDDASSLDGLSKAK